MLNGYMTFDDGDHMSTRINETPSGMARYYLENSFVARDEKTMRQVVRLVIDHTYNIGRCPNPKCFRAWNGSGDQVEGSLDTICAWLDEMEALQADATAAVAEDEKH